MSSDSGTASARRALWHKAPGPIPHDEGRHSGVVRRSPWVRHWFGEPDRRRLGPRYFMAVSTPITYLGSAIGQIGPTHSQPPVATAATPRWNWPLTNRLGRQSPPARLRSAAGP